MACGILWVQLHGRTGWRGAGGSSPRWVCAPQGGCQALGCIHGGLTPVLGGDGLSLVGNIWPRTYLLGWASPHKCQPKRLSLPPQRPRGEGQEHAPPQLGASTQHPQPSLLDPTLPNVSSPPNPSVPQTLSTPLPAVSPAQSRHLPSSPQPGSPPRRRVSPPLLSKGCLCLCLQN